MWGSNIASSEFEGSPVLESILTKLIPDGTLKGIFLIYFIFLRLLNMGTATDDPVCLYPNVFGIS